MVGSAQVYNDLAQLYDWEHRDFRTDLQMYLGFARATTGPILDAACGTGRVLLPLAEAGHSVTGVDLSPAMLEIARSRLGKGPLARRIRLVCADLRSMELREQYAMALVALSSFHHLLSVDDQLQALGHLAQHLERGAPLILDLVNPTPEWLLAGDGTLVHQVTGGFPLPEGPDLLSKFVARACHFESQMEQSLLVYDQTNPEGAVTRRTFQMMTRFLFRYEAELLLSKAGFRSRDLYGDYDLGSYRASSPRMIFVAERL